MSARLGFSGVSTAARDHDRLAQKRKAIHVKRRQLDMTDEAYRALLDRVAGVTSSTDLTPRDADAVLREFDRLGAPAGRQAHADPRAVEWRFVFRLTPDRQRFARKIFRCAEKIGRMQNPPMPVMPKAWVEGIAHQSLGYNAPGVTGKVAKKLELCDPSELGLIVQIMASWAHKKRAA